MESPSPGHTANARRQSRGFREIDLSLEVQSPPFDWLRDDGYRMRFRIDGYRMRFRIDGCGMRFRIDGCGMRFRIDGCRMRIRMQNEVQ